MRRESNATRVNKTRGQGGPIIEVRGLHKRFSRQEALRGVDLAFSAGETVCIVGASGSGKTTLLRCLNLLEIPTDGELYFRGELMAAWTKGASRSGAPRLAGRQLANYRANMAMVFQQFELFPHLTVLDNITLGPRRVLGRSPQEAAERAREILRWVGLAEYETAAPHTLSGGQQQRVAIARALAMEPDVILFDEPTSSLDPELKGEVLDVMKRLARDGVTMIVVTHEIHFARTVAKHVVVMDAGLVIEAGPPSEVLFNPKNQRTHEFLSSILSAEGET